MNLKKVEGIIRTYKARFDAISKEEIYKWRAVKRFQDEWDITADNFAEMLGDAFSQSRNLLSSRDYYPLRMLLLCARKEPGTVRNLFVQLYDEERDLIERIEDFQAEMARLNGRYYDQKKDYQDSRAVLAYLSFRFPDRYFFYKYGMFKEFVEKIDYPYKPKMGSNENVLVFLTLCSLLRGEIVKDKSLLTLHRQRLKDEHFFDSSYNILTQDIIYAAVRHFSELEDRPEQKSALQRLERVNKKLVAKKEAPVLKGTFTNYIENEKRRKRIGDRGELLVMRHEQERLEQSGSRKQPVHVSLTRGDGEGFDILSYDESGEEIFIEVKTTTSGCDSPFYITRNELKKSMEAQERFRLYRLYDFDETNDTAKFCVQSGSLESLCVDPVLYQVRAEEV